MKDPTRLAAIKALKPTPGPCTWTDGWAIGPSETPGRSALQAGTEMLLYSCDGCDLFDDDGIDFADLIIAAADPEYGLQALAAEVERLQEREKPNPALANGYGCSVCGDCAVPGKPYCPNCGRRLEWK